MFWTVPCPCSCRSGRLFLSRSRHGLVQVARSARLRRFVLEITALGIGRVDAVLASVPTTRRRTGASKVIGPLNVMPASANSAFTCRSALHLVLVEDAGHVAHVLSRASSTWIVSCASTPRFRATCRKSSQPLPARQPIRLTASVSGPRGELWRRRSFRLNGRRRPEIGEGRRRPGSRSRPPPRVGCSTVAIRTAPSSPRSHRCRRTGCAWPRTLP